MSPADTNPKAERVSRLKGTHDILPAQAPAWRHLEKTVADVMARSGYHEIRTPIFERTELFSRGVGAQTDMVSKEMYTLEDQGGKSLTLRPELTASIVRAYLQNNLDRESPLSRLYYLGPLFRQERPQKGRQRQFHQFGLEALGSPHPEQDVEVISIAWDLCRALAGGELTMRINTIGSPDSRAGYLDLLRQSLEPFKAGMGENDARRLATNPLRLFDTKDPETQALLKEHSPKISEHVSAADSDHYAAVQAGLDTLDIPFASDPTLVRGLDYYTRTTFEITSPVLGAQDALCGGGRYDGLVAQLGGPSTPAVGFAAGIERLLLAAGESGHEPAPAETPDVYMAAPGDDLIHQATALAQELRKGGLSVVQEVLRRSLKAQLREANRLGCRFAVIMGDTEGANKGMAVVKDMTSGGQTELPLDGIVAEIRRSLG